MTRYKIKISTHLILKQFNKILLSAKREVASSQYVWGLVAGHLEDNESVTDCIIREASEEIGIRLCKSDLELVHIMHGCTSEYIGFFFECTTWGGEIINKEVEKCADLQFFEETTLPCNLMPYVKQALDAIKNGNIYSEIGCESR